MCTAVKREIQSQDVVCWWRSGDFAFCAWEFIWTLLLGVKYMRRQALLLHGSLTHSVMILFNERFCTSVTKIAVISPLAFINNLLGITKFYVFSSIIINPTTWPCLKSSFVLLHCNPSCCVCLYRTGSNLGCLLYNLQFPRLLLAVGTLCNVSS